MKSECEDLWDSTLDVLIKLLEFIAGLINLLISIFRAIIPVKIIRYALISKYLTEGEVYRLVEVRKSGYFRLKQIKEFENELKSKQAETNN